MALSKTGPTSNVYEFQLVQFIQRGPQTSRSIDVVPTRWIDSKNGKTIVTKFMPPPYTPENNELLHTLIKADADPLASWPVYSVQIKGQANTYDEAVGKLNKLKTKQFVFTSESDVDPSTKAAEVQKKIIKAKKYSISEETRSAMMVQPIVTNIQTDPADLQEEFSTDDESSDPANDKQRIARKSGPKFTTKCFSHLPQQRKKMSVLSNNSVTPKTKKPIKKMPLSIRQQFQNDESLEHDTDKSSKNKTKNVGRLEHDTDKSSKNKTKQQHNAGDFAFIVSQLAGIATELKEMSANQQTILDRLNVARDCVIEEKFTEKHSLDLPFRSQPEFVKFNNKLHTNDEFRKNFISSLHSLLDRELKISKSLTNICKKYLSRDVALKYTVLRKVAGKSLLKDTMFYDCVLGVAIQTHKDHLTGKKITEQIVDSALGRVVNNAKDWDGQRQKRASSQSVRAPPAGIASKNDNLGAAHGPLTTDDSSYDEESGAEKSATGESDHEETDHGETDHKEPDNEEPHSEKDADGE